MRRLAWTSGPSAPTFGDMVAVRLGYASINLTLGVSAGHTCRLANASPERLEALIAWNLAELEQILLFNEAHGLKVFRIGSSLVPFASHPVNRLRWWRTFRRDFDKLAAIAHRSGQRLSMHPSPMAASLSSHRESVREASVAELDYSARVLDLLGQGPASRVIVHLGGKAPSRDAAMEAADRFVESLPQTARDRIAVEHDCRIWSAAEVLPLARRHGLPFVADTLHNEVLQSDPPIRLRELLALSAQTWRELDLRPKYHLSSQRLGARLGAHADYIDSGAFDELVASIDEPADVMVEAKQKDLAVFALQGQAQGHLGPPP